MVIIIHSWQSKFIFITCRNIDIDYNDCIPQTKYPKYDPKHTSSTQPSSSLATTPQSHSSDRISQPLSDLKSQMPSGYVYVYSSTERNSYFIISLLSESTSI